MENPNFLLAFLLTLFAGLATGIGSLMVFFSKKFNPKILSISLGFSAGVMIYISLVEIFFKAKLDLVSIYGEDKGYALTVFAFFLGILIIAIIDKIVPSAENPHEIKNMNFDKNTISKIKEKKLLRVGLFSALIISLHNLPEGLATFIAALEDPKLGVSISIAIAIHNIPEGIAVAMPIYYATKNKAKASIISFLSGLAEIVGALVGFVIIKYFFTDINFGFIFALIAGIMVYISLDELLPTAEEYGEHHLAITGVMLGMFVMAVSLVLL
ncbi:zinc transporter ZupT [Candidatus Gracilibacteria bacterium]|nr:zinc transporter ZupT [Candidatus Gracilibacteria bacterium]